MTGIVWAEAREGHRTGPRDREPRGAEKPYARRIPDLTKFRTTLPIRKMGMRLLTT